MAQNFLECNGMNVEKPCLETLRKQENIDDRKLNEHRNDASDPLDLPSKKERKIVPSPTVAIQIEREPTSSRLVSDTIHQG